MTQQQEGYLSPLDRLQQDAVSAAASPSEWLDQHREDVLAVWKGKGTTAIAAILGLTTSTLRGWAKRRKLGDGLVAKRTRREHKPHQRAGPAVKAARPAVPVGSSPRRGQASAKDPSPHHATSATAFWRGQAMAYKHALELVCRLLPGGREPT